MKDLLTINQVAEYIQCSAWTVRDWIRDGLLPHVRLGKRVIRVRRQDLEAFVEQSESGQKVAEDQ